MLLEGKKGLILGLSSDISIAWGITKACHQEGAKLCITYQNELMQKRAEPLAQQANAEMFLQCDAQDDASIDHVFEQISQKWGKLDFMVHSIAYAPKEELKNRFSETSRKGFHEAMDISAYSFIRFAGKAAPLMSEGGSILTLTYYGSEKVIPNYKIMGVCKAALESSVRELAMDLGEQNIRVNAISAGAIRTLASSGISNFSSLLKESRERTALNKICTTDDVGKSAVYLLSDLSGIVTGEVHHVDCGFNIGV